MKNKIAKLRKIIEHIAEVDDCSCEYCMLQESKTFIYGLRFALSVITGKTE